MTTLHFRVIERGQKDAECIEEQTLLDLSHFADACGQSQEWVLQLLEYDMLIKRAEHQQHQFIADDLSRAQQISRLQRDFNASFSAVAMMLDLIDEVQQLRREIKHSQFKHC